MYPYAGSLASGPLVALSSLSLLSLILATPVLSAFAEQFTVTTNKEIYTPHEKIIVVGVIPSGAPEGYPVLIKLTGEGGVECAAQNLLPEADFSFVSRPIKVQDCGLGEYTVSAYYADLAATSSFTVSSRSEQDVASKLELRIIKKVLLAAQDAVNMRIRGLVGADLAIPEDIADKYQQGVAEASMALQAVEFGNTADAKRHQVSAMQHFREVMDSLAAGQMAAFGQMASEPIAAIEAAEGSQIAEHLARVQEYRDRLYELAEKNGVNTARLFRTASQLLADARGMIEQGDIEGAEKSLGQANELLERIRVKLFEKAEEGNIASLLQEGRDSSDDSRENNDKDGDRSAASKARGAHDGPREKKLAYTADKLERRASALLSEAGSSEEALAKIGESLQHIENARSLIGEKSFEEARKSLVEAFKAFREAKNLIEASTGDN